MFYENKNKSRIRNKSLKNYSSNECFNVSSINYFIYRHKMMCKYCQEPEDKQNKPGLVCEKCASFVHLTCLKRPGTPGDFSCDVFFDFTCEGCTPDNKEMFVRNKFPWVNVLTLTLHHLSVQSYGISNHGFFHYKTHICSFIDRNWHLLFGMTCKQKKNWVGTIAGVLSVYNTLIFQSGSLVLGETGWWKLQHNFSPAVAAHIMQELTKQKPKGRLKMKSQMALDKMLLISKVSALGYQDLINFEKEPRALEPASKRRRVDSDESSVSGDQLDAECKTEICEESILEESSYQEGYSDVVVYPTYYDTTNASYILPSDSSSIHSYQPTTVFYDSDSRSGSPNHQQPEEDQKPDIKQLPLEKKTMEEKEKVIEKRDSLFSSQLNSTDLPWIEKTEESSKDLIEMTPYEEIQLLKQVEGLIPKVKDPNKRAYLQRFRAKLALRRLKRHKHLPIFDLDKTVKLLSGCATEDPRDVMNVERVLDRFQRSYLLDNLSGTIACPGGGAAVVRSGCARALRSPHSGATLTPYIRRDCHTTPTWLRLTQELMRRTHRHIPDYTASARAPLDYCYVRPQHIPAVNSLLAQFFWPGIDMSEALEYPEFSCVVMYRKLVVGCAFLVPDVGPHEAYVSFILTRPEWRNAGIATFMLYHLLQTCTGKDVTLHVSPTNPAIFLYQKFGFKVEEFIQDFYEKYYDIDYKGCRHALFLRLVR